MATKSFTDGVYDASALNTTVSNLSLSGSNNSVVLVTPGDVTTLGVFGLLYTDTGVGTYGAAREVTLTNAGDDTVFTTLLSADDTEMAIVDADGTTITFTLSDAADTTVFPDAVDAVNAVGPDHRRKHHLGY